MYFLALLAGSYLLLFIEALLLVALIHLLRIPEPGYGKAMATLLLGSIAAGLSAWMFSALPIVGVAAAAPGLLAYVVVLMLMLDTSVWKAAALALLHGSLQLGLVLALAWMGMFPQLWSEIRLLYQTL